MARHNEVTLYGTVMESPKLLYNTSDVHDPNRKLVRTIGILSVLRGIRDFGAVDKRIRIDLPIILSQNEKMMKAISAWKTGDVILMRGTLATVNYTLTLKCPHCGAPEAIPATMTFVNPIYMKKECESLEGVVNQYDTYLDTHFQMDVLECLKEKLQEKLRLDLFMLEEMHQFQFNL